MVKRTSLTGLETMTPSLSAAMPSGRATWPFKVSSRAASDADSRQLMCVGDSKHLTAHTPAKCSSAGSTTFNLSVVLVGQLAHMHTAAAFAPMLCLVKASCPWVQSCMRSLVWQLQRVLCAHHEGRSVLAGAPAVTCHHFLTGHHFGHCLQFGMLSMLQAVYSHAFIS